MEIVSKPDLQSPEEAAAYLKTLRAILIYLRVCDGNMEEGSLRCDANISLRPRGRVEYGTKVEIKNMNSFRNVRDALDYEVRRQARALETGERIVQETRLWDPDRAITVSMRSKEFAHDYRYFPEPDLPPLVVDDARVARIRAAMPEMPSERRRRFVAEYGLPEYDAGVLTQSPALAAYYEAVAHAVKSPKAASNWVMGELLRTLNDQGRSVEDSPLGPAALASLIGLIEKGTISGSIAKDVFATMFATGRSADDIVAAEGLAQIGDEEAVLAIVRAVIGEHADAVAQYRAGKKQTLGFLVGQVMKRSGGKANPPLANALLTREIDAS
jgi:aspartyl-tRNA(Asn)/glutamyl-tRNA(Gln) amidotransferase subunit B